MPRLRLEALRQTKPRHYVHTSREADIRSGYSGSETIVALWGRHLGFHPLSPPHQPPPMWLCSTSLGRGFPQTLWHHCPADGKHKESYKKGCLLFINYEWGPWLCCLSHLCCTLRQNTVLQTETEENWKSLVMFKGKLIYCKHPQALQRRGVFCKKSQRTRQK